MGRESLAKGQLSLYQCLAGSEPQKELYMWLEDKGFKRYNLHKLQNIEQGREHHRLDVLDHCLETLAHMAEMTSDPILRYCAFFHDIGKPSTRIIKPDGRISFPDHAQKGATIIKDLTGVLTKDGELPGYIFWQTSFVCTKLHMDVQIFAEDLKVSKAALRRLRVKAGPFLDKLFMVCEADRKAQYNKSIEPLKELKRRIELAGTYIPQHNQVRCLLTGHRLVELIGSAGPIIGQAKKALSKAEKNGIVGTAEEAEQFILLKKYLPQCEDC